MYAHTSLDLHTTKSKAIAFVLDRCYSLRVYDRWYSCAGMRVSVCLELELEQYVLTATKIFERQTHKTSMVQFHLRRQLIRMWSSRAVYAKFARSFCSLFVVTTVNGILIFLVTFVLLLLLLSILLIKYVWVCVCVFVAMFVILFQWAYYAILLDKKRFAMCKYGIWFYYCSFLAEICSTPKIQIPISQLFAAL